MLANIPTDDEVRSRLPDGVTVKEWMRLQELRQQRKEEKTSGAFDAMAHVVKEREDVMVDGFKPINEIFRDEPPRRIAERVLQGGTKREIMDDLIASPALVLRTKKTPEQALVQDIPYVVRRLRHSGYDIVKQGRAYVWANSGSEPPSSAPEPSEEVADCKEEEVIVSSPSPEEGDFVWEDSAEEKEVEIEDGEVKEEEVDINIGAMLDDEDDVW